MGMNWSEINKTLRTRYHLTGDKRSLRVARKVAKHQNFLRRIRAIDRNGEYIGNGRYIPKVWDTQQWKLMRTAIDEGRKIVAFDAEWTYRLPIIELGVAIYDRGVIHTHNVRWSPGGKGFLYGSTRFTTEKLAKTWVEKIMGDCDLLLGHAIHNDRDQMRLWGLPLPAPEQVPFVDTGSWSRILNRKAKESVGLTKFAAEHGVVCDGAHVAGNDARITLDVALKLAGMTE